MCVTPNQHEGASPLLALSTELLTAIFLELDDFRDLEQCRLVCQIFEAVLSTPAMQYKCLLGYAGMIDVIPNAQEPNLSARLNSVATYLQAWREAQLSLNGHLTDSSHGIDCVAVCSPGAVIPSLDRITNSYHFFLPASTIRRPVEAREWTLRAEHAPAPIRFCEVDHSQDLIVIVTCLRNDPNTPTCLFRSLSNPSAVHPHSFGDIVTSTSDPDASVDDVQICGAFLGRKASNFSGDIAMDVYNWQTGASYSIPFDLHDVYVGLRFIDDSCILLLVRDQLRVHFVGDTQPSRIYRTPSTARGWRSMRQREWFKSRMPVEETPQMSRSLFRADPFSAIFAIYFFNYEHDEPVDKEHFLLLGPCLTLTSGGLLRGDNQHRAALEWDEWGPQGTRLFRLRQRVSSISVLGSKCAAAFTRTQENPNDPRYVDVFLIDLLPSAKTQVNSPPEDDMFARYFYAQDAMDHVRSWEGTLRTFLPYRSIHKEVCYESRQTPVAVVVTLTDDGLVVALHFNGGRDNSFYSLFL